MSLDDRHQAQVTGTRAGLKIAFVTSIQRPTMLHAVCDELSRRGWSAQVMTDRDFDLSGAQCIVTVGTGIALTRLTRALERLGPDRAPHIAWITEPLPPLGITPSMLGFCRWLSPARWGRDGLRPVLHAFSRPVIKAMLMLQDHKIGDTDARLVRYCCDNLAWLDRCLARGALDRVAASTDLKRRQLSRWGFPAFFLPVPRHDGFGQDLALDRTVDVLFVGRLKSRRREKTLAQLQTDLEQRGRSVRIVSEGLYGADRTQAVNAARIMLHLHQFPSDTPWTRWHIASASGAAVASEPLMSPEPFRPGRDYLSAPVSELADEIDALLSEEDRRREMVANCRDRIAATMSLPIVCDTLCAQISEVVSVRDDPSRSNALQRGP